MSFTCQEIASPSRSGSVASHSRLAPFSAVAILPTCALAPPVLAPDHREILVGQDGAVLFLQVADMPEGLASTVKSRPRYFSIVLALAGDSTTTTSDIRSDHPFGLRMTR